MSQPLSPLLGHANEFSGEGLKSFTHGLPLSSSPDQVRNYWKPPLEDPKGKSWFIKPKITIFQAFGQRHHLSLLRVLLCLALCCSAISYNSLISPFWSAGQRWRHCANNHAMKGQSPSQRCTARIAIIYPQASILN